MKKTKKTPGKGVDLKALSKKLFDEDEKSVVTTVKTKKKVAVKALRFQWNERVDVCAGVYRGSTAWRVFVIAYVHLWENHDGSTDREVSEALYDERWVDEIGESYAPSKKAGGSRSLTTDEKDQIKDRASRIVEARLKSGLVGGIVHRDARLLG